MFNPSYGGSGDLDEIESDKTVNKILKFIDEGKFNNIKTGWSKTKKVGLLFF